MPPVEVPAYKYLVHQNYHPDGAVLLHLLPAHIVVLYASVLKSIRYPPAQ